jgi:hypothetical protein
MVCVNTSGFFPTVLWHRSHYSNCKVEACIQQILLPHWLVVTTVMDGGGDLLLKLWKWSFQSTGTAAHRGRNLIRQHMVDNFIYKTRCDNFPKQLVGSISSQRPMFNPSLRQKQLVVDEVAIGQVFLQILQFSLVSSPSLLHVHSFMPSLKPYDLRN